VKEFFKGILWFAMFMVIIAVIGRIFLFDIVQTHSFSMVPNLLPGDTFLVWRDSVLGEGDIAVCTDPEEPSQKVVLRVIGVPGSTISVTRNIIELNKFRIDHIFPGPPVMYEDHTNEEDAESHISIAEEYLGGHKYSIALMENGDPGDHEKTEVEEGFFLLGDNRNRARDSRNFGEVPIEDCTGRVFMMAWPGPDSGDFKLINRIIELF